MVTITSPIILGAVLRETRTAQNIPAEAMAMIVGTTPVTLRRLENGNATEAIQTLFRLLDELGVELKVKLPPGLSIPEVTKIQKPRRTRVKT